jgi:hypothetical protein
MVVHVFAQFARRSEMTETGPARTFDYDAGGSPSDDAGTTGTDDDAGSPPTGTGDDAGGISLAPISFPDGGLGGSPPASSDDGGVCTTKICIDPVFDCPLQGCFNGCTNVHCN